MSEWEVATMPPDSGLGGKTWDESLLQNTRCPFLRAAASADGLQIVNGHNLQSKPVLVATVDSVRNAGNGLANVLAFFAKFNHTRGLKPDAENPLLRLRQTEFNLDQSTDQNISDGTHPGSVDIIRGGSFTPEVVAAIRKIAGNSTLTPEAMARVIVAANHADNKATVIDLAKSAGEWGLMFCLLQDHDGNIPIDDLEQLCKTKVLPPQGQENLAKSSTREWIQYTTVITAHIAHEQPDAANDEVAGSLHQFWCEQNDDPDDAGCGWAQCTQGKPGLWDNQSPSIRNAIASFGDGLSRWFKFH